MYIRKVVIIVALLSPLVAACAEEPGLQITGASIRISQNSGEGKCDQCTVKLEASQAIRFQADRIFLDKDTASMRQESETRVSLQVAKELSAERLAPNNFHVQINPSAAGRTGFLSFGAQVLCGVLAHSHCYVR